MPVYSHKTKEGEDVFEVSSYPDPAIGNTPLDANNQPRLLGPVSHLHGMWSVSAKILFAGLTQCQGRQRYAGKDASLCVPLASSRTSFSAPCRMLIKCAFCTFSSMAFRSS